MINKIFHNNDVSTFISLVLVIDGSGNPRYYADVGIKGDTIAAIGNLIQRIAVMGVDPRSATQEELDEMKSILRQAMTEGAWGLSMALQYIPDQFAKTEELIAMTEVVDECVGVLNSHQRSEEAEVVAAVKETIRIGQETGVLINATHLKASGKNNWELLQDVSSLINAARDRGIYVTADLYTYPQCVYFSLGMVLNVPDEMEPLSELVDMIDYYYILRRMGVSVDDYIKTGKPKPMPRSDVRERYVDILVDALKEDTKKEQIRTLTLEGTPDKLNWVPMFGWDSFTTVESKKHPNLIGRIISDIAREQGRESFDLAAELLSEEKNDLIISVFTMSGEDIAFALKQDWVMVCSDSGAASFRPGTKGHPGPFGTFTRVLRKFVREENLLSLENAIRKMTSLPAQFLGMKKRGLVLEGFKADIVVFNPETARDNSNYMNSHQLSSGIEYVLINGKVNIEKGSYNNTLNGKVLVQDSYE